MQLAGRMPSNRDAIGTQVRVTIAGKTIMRQVEAGSGFSSEVMLPIHFGLGSAPRIETAEIKWPSGRLEKFDSAQTKDWINSRVQIEEGNGKASEVTPDRQLAGANASRREANGRPM